MFNLMPLKLKPIDNTLRSFIESLNRPVQKDGCNLHLATIPSSWLNENKEKIPEITRIILAVMENEVKKTKHYDVVERPYYVQIRKSIEGIPRDLLFGNKDWYIGVALLIRPDSSTPRLDLKLVRPSKIKLFLEGDFINPPSILF
jgi:hypothetical protein